LERHRPVDLLPDRSSTSLAAWLRAHPGVRIIARDRAGAYAEGSRAGAPDAVQVADRWHLVDNLADALETCFRPRGTALKAAAAATAGRTTEPGQTRPPPDEIYQGKRRHPRPAAGRARADAAAEERVARRRANDEAARTLHAEGVGVSQIARQLGIARMTVYNYLHGGPPQRKRHTMHGQQRVIEPWKPYLLKRWEEGCRMATRLWREIQAQGFAYSLTNVQRFVNQLRREGMPTPAQRPSSSLTKIQGPSARGVAALVLQRPERRAEEARTYLRHLIAQDPAIATTIDLSTDFLVMLRRREGERLPGWLDQAVTSGVPELGRFAAKLQGDLAAVQAGLTLRQSNGQTRGRSTG
jgi:transposase